MTKKRTPRKSGHYDGEAWHAGPKTKACDKMSAKKRKKSEPILGPTLVRAWWLVDVEETRTLKVFATGPANARDIAAHVMMDLYPPTIYRNELGVIQSFAHTVKCGDGRSTRGRR